MRFFLIVFLLFQFTRSSAQISADSTASLLSGSQYKEWVASPWKIVMGMSSQKKCNGGESYTFFKGDSAEMRKCVNGSITIVKYKWKVIRQGNDNFLYMGDNKYQIRSKIGRNNELKLRVLVGDKITLSNEVILKFEKY